MQYDLVCDKLSLLPSSLPAFLVKTMFCTNKKILTF